MALTTIEEFERKRDGFAQKTTIPVFAIVDGTQIHLAALDHEIEATYVNRRGITAINTQVSNSFRKVRMMII